MTDKQNGDLAVPVFLTADELIEIESILLRTRGDDLEASRRLGVLVGKLAQAREEIPGMPPVADEW